MHIIALFISVMAAAGFWYWRVASAARVASEVGDMAGRLQGKVKRRLFRRKVEAATISGIEDPRLGAAVLFVSIVEAGRRISPDDEVAISDWLRDVAEEEKPDEALIFARWACREVVDVNEVLRRIMPLFKEKLGPAERIQLVEMAASLTGRQTPEPPQTEALRRLRLSLLPDGPNASLH